MVVQQPLVRGGQLSKPAQQQAVHRLCRALQLIVSMFGLALPGWLLCLQQHALAGLGPALPEVCWVTIMQQISVSVGPL